MGELVSLIWAALFGAQVMAWWQDRRRRAPVPSNGGDQALDALREDIDRAGLFAGVRTETGWRVTAQRTIEWGDRRFQLRMVEVKKDD